jgi:hypothetical protein
MDNRLQSEVVKLNSQVNNSSGKKSRNIQNFSREFESTNNVNIIEDAMIIPFSKVGNVSESLKSNQQESYQSPR